MSFSMLWRASARSAILKADGAEVVQNSKKTGVNGKVRKRRRSGEFFETTFL